MQNPYYQTSDSPLAVTLATCGVPFMRSPKGIVPLYNLYTDSLLRRHGYKDITRDEAAIRAWRAGQRGFVTYNFERNELLDRLIKVWKDQTKSIEEATAAQVTEMSSPPVPVETVALICCQFAANRKWLTETAWRKTLPMVAFDAEVHRESDGVFVGSVKACTANASPELRKELGF